MRLLFSLLLLPSLAQAVEFADYDFNRWSREVTECDRLAAHGSDPGSVAGHVSRSEMNIPAAIDACHAALETDPDNPRLNYQLGRAYAYAARGDEAMPYREKALAVDYPQSTFVTGYIRMLGMNIEQDTCAAVELWRNSARYRRLAALVSLPHHYLRGDFDECGVEIPDEELRAYLNEAKTVSDDYYVQMLISELLANLSRQANGEASH